MWGFVWEHATLNVSILTYNPTLNYLVFGSEIRIFHTPASFIALQVFYAKPARQSVSQRIMTKQLRIVCNTKQNKNLCLCASSNEFTAYILNVMTEPKWMRSASLSWYFAWLYDISTTADCFQSWCFVIFCFSLEQIISIFTYKTVLDSSPVSHWLVFFSIHKRRKKNRV